MTLPLLLVGAEAEVLAERLALSGYRPLRLQPGQAEPVPIALDHGLDSTVVHGSGHRSDLGSEQEAAPPPSAPAAAPADPASNASPPLAVVLSPGEEGCIAALRSRWGALPILLGLADDSVEGRSRTLLSGADDFWLTGLGPSDLLTRLRLHRHLLSIPAAVPERLQVADLQLFPTSRQVRRGDRGLALTAREYQLLLLLLEHRDRVLSREEILRQVWPDQQQGGASNVIEVYVRYLRQKLEQGGERRLIHTVRGRGYCLSERLPSPSAT